MRYKILPPRFIAIAKKYGFPTVHLVRPGDEFHKANGDIYKNSSYMTGGIIWVGLYTSMQRMLASLFHEIGHTLTNDCPIMMPHMKSRTHHPCSRRTMEACAWRSGLELGAKYGFVPSKRTLEWIREQMETYSGE